MLDTSKENAMPIAVLARAITNRNGTKGVNVATVWRWINKGVKGVRLDSVMIGGIRCSSTQALERFFAGVTAASTGKPVSVPAERRQAIEAANKALDAAGII